MVSNDKAHKKYGGASKELLDYEFRDYAAENSLPVETKEIEIIDEKDIPIIEEIAMMVALTGMNVSCTGMILQSYNSVHLIVHLIFYNSQKKNPKNVDFSGSFRGANQI